MADLVPEAGRRIVGGVLGNVVPVEHVAGLVEHAVSAGEDELEAFALVRLEDWPRVDQPTGSGFVAVADEHVVVADMAVEPLALAARGERQVARRALGVVERGEPAQQDVRPHAGLLHGRDGFERLLIAVAAVPVDRLAVRHVVAQDRHELPARQFGVSAVLLLDHVDADVRVGCDQEIALGVAVRLRRGQHERQHTQRHRNRGQRLPFLADPDRTGIRPRLHVFPDVRREEELHEAPARKRHGTQGRGIGKAGLHRRERVRLAVVVEEAAVHLARRVDPHLFRPPAARRRDAGVIGLLRLVDADQVLVVEQQLGDELESGVAEIVEPGIAVLVPDLHEPQIEVGGRELGAVLGFQRPDREVALAEVVQRADDEGAGLVFAACGNDRHRGARHAVRRIGVRQTLHSAHGRHGVTDDRPPRRGVEKIARDAHGVGGHRAAGIRLAVAGGVLQVLRERSRHSGRLEQRLGLAEGVGSGRAGRWEEGRRRGRCHQCRGSRDPAQLVQ